MQTVDVLVSVFRQGRRQETVVPVEESAFFCGCWRTMALCAAAVNWGCAFTEISTAPKFGMRPEDRARLAEMVKEEPEAPADTEEETA